MQSSIFTSEQTSSRHDEQETQIELHPAQNRLVSMRTHQSSLQILINLMNWLVGVFQLSEEEKIEAGIFSIKVMGWQSMISATNNTCSNDSHQLSLTVKKNGQ